MSENERIKSYLLNVINIDIICLTIARDRAFDDYIEYVATHIINGHSNELKDRYIKLKDKLEEAKLMLKVVENMTFLNSNVTSN